MQKTKLLSNYFFSHLRMKFLCCHIQQFLLFLPYFYFTTTKSDHNKSRPTKPGQSHQKHLMVFYSFAGCSKSFDHLVPSPVGDTQLYHTLGMGLGDKNHSNTQRHTQKPSSITGHFVLVL